MLLPILILRPDINKCLNNLVYLAKQKGWIACVWKFIDAIVAQFCYLPVAATTSATINYLPNWPQQNTSKAYTSKYVYVFASQMQKKPTAF